MGTPINLVRNDGGLIPLMCTTLVMNVDRRVVPIPVPFGGGSRLGFDLNLPGATITLEGIIADEDKFSNAGAKKASAIIDFDEVVSLNLSNFGAFPFSTSDNLEKIVKDTVVNDPSSITHAIRIGTGGPLTSDIGLTKNTTNSTNTTANVTNGDATVTVASVNGISVGMSVTGTHIPGSTTVASITNATTFELSQPASGGSYTGGTLTFSGTYGKATHSGATRLWVSVYNTTTSTARTAAEIAADFTALVNQETATFGLTANTINSPNTGGSAKAVRLEQNATGKAGNVTRPAFPIWGSNAVKPFHTQFDGGKENTSASGYSAGDRVAELYAVLNNSNNGGLGAVLGSIPAMVSEAFGEDDEGWNPLDNKYGDYIIALQIPFTSTVNSNASLFYMPTGPMKQRQDKTVDNAKPVGTEMITSFGPYEYTGIKGAVANATFTQLGGEPLYSFTINFVPIDWIV